MMQENEKEANSMPKVGDKDFPYTPEGIAAAKAESQNIGSGKTGFAGIGRPDLNISPIGEQGGNQPMGYNPHLREVAPADVMQASEVYYEDGGKVEDKIHKKGSPKKSKIKGR